MKHLAAALVTALTIITATAAIAAADRLVLHSKDSLTLDGKTYACDDPSSSGVHLAIGDRLTIGGLDLRCHAGGGTAAAAVPSVDVESHVDRSCISQLVMVSAGPLTWTDLIRFAGACRTFEIGKQCTPTIQDADADCFSQLVQVGPAQAAGDAASAQNACHATHATCPAPAAPVESKIDASCVTRTLQVASASPDMHAIVGILDACRTRPVGACVVVGGSQDASCITQVLMLTSNHGAPADTAAIARACRTLQLACP